MDHRQNLILKPPRVLIKMNHFLIALIALWSATPWTIVLGFEEHAVEPKELNLQEPVDKFVTEIDLYFSLLGYLKKVKSIATLGRFPFKKFKKIKFVPNDTTFPYTTFFSWGWANEDFEDIESEWIQITDAMITGLDKIENNRTVYTKSKNIKMELTIPEITLEGNIEQVGTAILKNGSVVKTQGGPGYFSIRWTTGPEPKVKVPVEAEACLKPSDSHTAKPPNTLDWKHLHLDFDLCVDAKVQFPSMEFGADKPFEFKWNRVCDDVQELYVGLLRFVIPTFLVRITEELRKVTFDKAVEMIKAHGGNIVDD